MTSDSDFRRFTTFFRKVWSDPVWSAVISAIIVAIPTMVLSLMGFKWTLLFMFAVMWLFFFWAYRSKVETDVIISTNTEGKWIPRFSKRWRRRFFIGMIVLPIFAIAWLVARYIPQIFPPSKTLILVSKFYGNNPKHTVTETIISRVRDATSKFKDIQVKGSGKEISESEGEDAAIKQGRDAGATIVIWGFFDEALNVTIHATLTHGTRQPHFYLITGTPESEGRKTITENIASDSFNSTMTLKESLSGNMSLLALSLVALIHYRDGDYDGAISRFSDALKQPTTPQSSVNLPNLFFYLGHSWSYKGNLDQAITAYSSAIEHDPTFDRPYFGRGSSYLMNGAFGQAIADFNNAIKTNPNYMEAYLGRAAAHNNKGDVDLAIADCNHVIENSSDVVLVNMAHFARGISYSRKDNLDQAISDFNRSIEKNIESVVPSARKYRGTSFLGKADFDRAIDDFTYLIDRNTKDPMVYLNRGVAYFYKRDLDQAIADFSYVIEIQPNMILAYLNRGKSLSDEGNYYQAILDYNEVIKRSPDNAEAYYHRGITYEKIKDKYKAIDDFRKAYDIDANADIGRQAVDKLNHIGVAPK